MATKRHRSEEIVAKLRQIEVLTAQGRTVAEAIRSIGVTEVTFYRRPLQLAPTAGPQGLTSKLGPHANRVDVGPGAGVRPALDMPLGGLGAAAGAGSVFRPR